MVAIVSASGGGGGGGDGGGERDLAHPVCTATKLLCCGLGFCWPLWIIAAVSRSFFGAASVGS